MNTYPWLVSRDYFPPPDCLTVFSHSFREAKFAHTIRELRLELMQLMTMVTMTMMTHKATLHRQLIHSGAYS